MYHLYYVFLASEFKKKFSNKIGATSLNKG